MSPSGLRAYACAGLILALWFCMTLNSYAERLRIDFNQAGGGDFPVHTQEDYDAFALGTGGGSNTLRFGTVTVALSADLGSGLDDRRRTVLTNTFTFTNAPLLQDFIFNVGATSTNSGMTIRVKGLTAHQSHQFTVWSYDSGSAGNRVSDWYANGNLVKNNHTFNGTVRPTANSDYRFTFNATADASGEVLIVGRRDATSVDQNNAAATGVFLNGLEIESIPSQAPPCSTTEHLKPGSNLYGWTAGGSFEEQNQEVAALAEAGIKYARINMAWHGVEPTAKGSYDGGLLSLYDNLMARLAERGIKAIFVTADTPYWASADPNKFVDGSGQHWEPKYKPSNFSDLADYYVFLANRYAASGPHVYEIWNEQNVSFFWPSGVDATNYVSMLQTCYTAIKAVEPRAIILNGGLTDGSNTTNYMAQMYAAGAKPYFDAWSQHTYQRTPQYETIVPKVRDLMDSHGDAAKKIWITECGWLTYTNIADPSAVSYARQAHYLTNFFTRLASYPSVEVAVWYTSRSYDENTHEGSFGLMLPDFTRKPSYYAFRDWISAANRRCSPSFINLKAPALMENGNRRILFQADPEFTYTLQVSSDLTTWQNLSTNVPGTNGAFSYDDANTSTSNGFYRVKSP